MENEAELFLKDLTGNNESNDPLTDPLIPETDSSQEQQGQDGKDENDEDNSTRARNRRERRLEAKLQAERESGIALAARLQAITEANRTKEEADYLKSIERIYGTDSPEALTATELLKNALIGAKEEAKQAAIEAIRQEHQEAQQAVATEEANLEQMIEDIEDEFGVALNAEQQRGYFRLMEKLSAKDQEGNIIAYADPLAVYEEYVERSRRASSATGSRAKDLASRSMTQSTSSTGKPDDSLSRLLSEHGLI